MANISDGNFSTQGRINQMTPDASEALLSATDGRNAYKTRMEDGSNQNAATMLFDSGYGPVGDSGYRSLSSTSGSGDYLTPVYIDNQGAEASVGAANSANIELGNSLKDDSNVYAQNLQDPYSDQSVASASGLPYAGSQSAILAAGDGGAALPMKVIDGGEDSIQSFSSGSGDGGSELPIKMLAGGPSSYSNDASS